jgi:hypothetical protein
VGDGAPVGCWGRHAPASSASKCQQRHGTMLSQNGDLTAPTAATTTRDSMVSGVLLKMGRVIEGRGREELVVGDESVVRGGSQSFHDGVEDRSGAKIRQWERRFWRVQLAVERGKGTKALGDWVARPGALRSVGPRARHERIQMAQGETGADHPTAAARIRCLGVHARDGRLRVRIGKRLKVVEESLRWPVHAERLRDPATPSSARPQKRPGRTDPERTGSRESPRNLTASRSCTEAAPARLTRRPRSAPPCWTRKED